ncbi:MAG: carboxypeptidase regulatory-like domain-containing protein [Deltaproteobacteria bacterium]|nr:carboxypeptidase regulatory-like domain-containing protein [Deltaproteobacteria bacterium]
MIPVPAFTFIVFSIMAIAAAPAVQAGDPGLVPQGARVTGRVTVSGSSEAPPPLKVFKNRDFCGDTVPNETLLVGRDGGLRNAVAMLRPLDRVVTSMPGRVVLDNYRCAFVPHVQVATMGSELILTNSDRILHTVHARLGKETLFNVGLPTWRQVTKQLDRAGVIRIDCDVLHTWMSAAIIVVTTPYFSVTDTNGDFILDGLPAGSYELEVWHERLGAKTTRVNLGQNGRLYADVYFSFGGKTR